MNACLSCLGLGRSSSKTPAESLERSRLLYNDSRRGTYGTDDASFPGALQAPPDPDVIRREREQMESICNRMSDQVVDVFAVVPKEHRKSNHNERNSVPALATQLSSTEQIDESGSTLATHNQRKPDQSKLLPSEMPQGDGGHDGPEAEDAFRTVRRKKHERLSIVLDRRESQAAKAAMG